MHAPPEALGSRAAERRRRIAWGIAFAAPLAAFPWSWLWSSTLPGQPLGTVPGFVLLLLGLTCAWTDLRWRMIPNWATYTGFIWGVALNLAVARGEEKAWPPGYIGFPDALLGAVACFLVMLLIYSSAGGGAGDVKLATAFGAYLGVAAGLSMLVYAYVAAAVCILGWVVFREGPVRLLAAFLRRIGAALFPARVAPPTREQLHLLRRRFPLAPFYALGAWIAFLGGVVPW